MNDDSIANHSLYEKLTEKLKNLAYTEEFMTSILDKIDPPKT